MIINLKKAKIVTSVFLLTGHAAYASIIYQVNIPTTEILGANSGVTGTITTDGTLGVLSTANIASLDLFFQGNEFTTLPEVSGVAATTSHLQFSTTTAGYIEAARGYPQPTEFFAFSPQSVGIAPLTGSAIIEYPTTTPITIFATARVPATLPEPATVALMGLGLVGMAVARREIK